MRRSVCRAFTLVELLVVMGLIKIMPYVNPSSANDTIARGGVQVADAEIYRRPSDTSRVLPCINPSTGVVDGITNRTSSC